MNLTDFLSVFEFTYELTNDNKIRLVDLQGANLGGIEEDRFYTTEQIIDRLEIYINDSIISEFENELEAFDINCDSMNLAQMVKKCRELKINDVCYDLANAIIHPEVIKIEKVLNNGPVEDMNPKKYDYKWIEFISNNNVVEVKNSKDFADFKAFLQQHGLIDILGNNRSFDDWQRLAKINNQSENLFLFEYANQKGLSWSDDREAAIEWYDNEPLKPMDLLKDFIPSKSIIDDKELC